MKLLRYPATYKSGLNILDNSWGGLKSISSTTKIKEDLNLILKEESEQRPIAKNNKTLFRKPFKGSPRFPSKDLNYTV